MSAAPYAVAVRGAHKVFELPHERRHTLKERALHPFSRTTVDRLEVLRDVSFQVAPGEFFGVVGRNGSGKSTLLKCLAGIYGLDSGEIWLRGRVAPFIELGVGFNPELTARDNVILNAIMLGLTPAEARERYDAVIEFAELADFVDLKLKNYSSGMQVRLAFGVMVQVDADVLLIDEVLAVGDASFQQKCHDTLQRMRDEGRTILLVTHDMATVEHFCDRAMLIDHGRLVDIGAPRSVARHYNQLNFAYAERPRDAEAPAEHRLGDGAVTVVDAWFEDATGLRTSVLEEGTECTFRLVVEAQREVEEPVLGMLLDDDQHRRVFATSTAWEMKSTGRFAAGERAEVAIRIENVLAPGRYLASPFAAYRGRGDHLMDLRTDTVPLQVTGARATGGLVNMPHDIEVRRRQAAPLQETGR